MSFLARRLVSKKKLRFQEDGFDLDLSYITKRVIAMGFPSEGREGLFRNPLQEVQRFLERYHPGAYHVYNLCSEREYASAGAFGGKYSRFPFDDHQPPPLRLLARFCEHAATHLAASPANVVVPHCKAGKGRTGLVICALLVHTGQSATAEEAMSYFGNQRTSNGKGVTIPSQRRYVKYYERMRAHGAPPPRPLRVRKLVATAPGVSNLLVVAWWRADDWTGLEDATPRPLFSTASSSGPGFQKVSARASNGRVEIDLPDNLRAVRGDIKLGFYDGKTAKDKCIFYTWFNTAFVGDDFTLDFKHKDLDKVKKSLSASGVGVRVTLAPPPGVVVEPQARLSEDVSAQPTRLKLDEVAAVSLEGSSSEIGSSAWALSPDAPSRAGALPRTTPLPQDSSGAPTTLFDASRVERITTVGSTEGARESAGDDLDDVYEPTPTSRVAEPAAAVAAAPAGPRAQPSLPPPEVPPPLDAGRDADIDTSINRLQTELREERARVLEHTAARERLQQELQTVHTEMAGMRLNSIRDGSTVMPPPREDAATAPAASAALERLQEAISAMHVLMASLQQEHDANTQLHAQVQALIATFAAPGPTPASARVR